MKLQIIALTLTIVPHQEGGPTNQPILFSHFIVCSSVKSHKFRPGRKVSEIANNCFDTTNKSHKQQETLLPGRAEPSVVASNNNIPNTV